MALFIFVPVLYVVVKSFENPVGEDAGGFLSFINAHVSLLQYKSVLFHQLDYWIGFWNTVVLVIPIIALVVFISTLAAYGLALIRKQRVKRNMLSFYILLALLPTQVLLVPNFIALSDLHLIGSRLSIILVCCFSPYYVFFCFRFLRQIPVEVFEAARIEGAGEFAIYRKMAVPQMRAGIFSLILIGVSDFWNMIEQPLAFLQEAEKLPLSLTLRDMSESLQYAGSLVFSVPLVLLFVCCIKDWEEGMFTC